jgi:hypothetical protein
MSSSVLYMSMSLDGYIAGPNDEPGNPGGEGFDRLHEWGATANGDRPSGPAFGGELSAGDVCDRRDRERDGAGEGCGRGPGRVGAWRVHGATGA